MSSGTTVRFSDLVGSGALAVSDGYRAKLSELGQGGPVFLRAGALRDQGFDWAGLEEFLDDAPIQSKLGRPGDVVITTKGNSTGRVGWVPRDAPEFVYSPHLSFWRSLDKSVINGRYLYYWSRSSEFARQLANLAHGTDMAPYLSLRDQLSLTISLPGPDAQQAIAEVLGALDDKIAANSTLAETADRYASALLERSLTTERIRLDSIARITMGSSPKGETLNEAGDGVPFYQGVRDFGFRSPAKRVFTTAPVRSAIQGDVLVSVRAPVGNVNVADEAICIGRGVAAVRSASDMQVTLFHLLKAEREAWEPYEAEGTIFGSINRDQLHAIELRAVVEAEKVGLEQQLADIERSVSALLAENRTVATTRDALLPQLMSGKLRVRDAEKIAEEV